MTEWVEALNATAAGGPRLAAAVLWQSAVLAGMVALVCAGIPRAAPAVRYWLWQVVALKLLLMPFWTLALPLSVWPEPIASGTTPFSEPWVPPAPMSAGTATLSTAPHVSAERPAIASAGAWIGLVSWQAWLALAWLAGVAVQVGGLAWQRRRLAELLGRAEPTDASIATRVVELCTGLGLRRPPRIALVEGAGSPFVCGARRPVVVLPRDTLAMLSPGQLRQVLLHELAHVRRRDLLWGWLPEAARVVWWFNPLAWWVVARVRLERELACDQLVLNHGGASAADYAETLVQVVSQATAP
jgi:beta-lactamase regulating signal transducer with metallopeptidase domain